MRFTRGNILEAETEALVNTVNTVGVMGKGIALMFREKFPDNYRAYRSACRAGEVGTGKMFLTERQALIGPKWIINFPTKRHWRHPSRLEWIREGLQDLRRILREKGIRSVAIPPLGCGNGRLDWPSVRAIIEEVLGDLDSTDIVVYQPTEQYQNIRKDSGVSTLTPARALITEMVRKYSVLGFQCTLLEIQKLAWFLEWHLERLGPDNPLDLRFTAGRYGPYAHRLDHLLNSLDGSFLCSEKRIADSGPSDTVWFNEDRAEDLRSYLQSPEGARYAGALRASTDTIEGFESPFGLELLATVHWLLNEGATPSVSGIRDAMAGWPGGTSAAERKLGLFDSRMIELALERLATKTHG